MPTISIAPAVTEVSEIAKRILVAVLFVPLLLAVILALPTVFWAAVIAFIAGMAAFELLRAAGEGRIPLTVQVSAVLAAAVIPLGTWRGRGCVSGYVCIFLVMALAFWCAIRAYDEGKGPLSLYHVMLAVFAGGILPSALSTLVALQRMEHGRYLVVLTVLLNFVVDGAAYFGGVFLGKHRGVTKVSPNKSLEGYLCGFLGGGVFAGGFGLFLRAVDHCQVNLGALILCGVLGALATELGDLAFSLIKRQCGVKDYGRLLPGHGGMLDRFDSMIFCSPVMYFILTRLPVF